MIWNLHLRAAAHALAMPLLCGVKKTVITPAALFAFGATMLVATGCNRPSVAAQRPAGTNTSVVAASQAQPSSTSATQPSALQYMSSAVPGQAVVSGTSTLHDWTVKTSVLSGNASFIGSWSPGAASAVTLQSANLAIPVNSLKSTEGSGMDDKMYDALKLQQFPSITYSQTRATLNTAPSNKDPAYHFDTIGQLAIAGAAHPVALNLAVLPHEHNQLTITTDVQLKMSDFGITPPTAMFGMIKSGDPIIVKVSWQLTAQAPATIAQK
jgi:hypothetical protein